MMAQGGLYPRELSLSLPKFPGAHHSTSLLIGLLGGYLPLESAQILCIELGKQALTGQENNDTLVSMASGISIRTAWAAVAWSWACKAPNLGLRLPSLALWGLLAPWEAKDGGVVINLLEIMEVS